MKKLLVKDFEIRSFGCGSRIQGGPEWAYEIIYHTPDGKTVRLDRICYKYESARKYIREVIRLAEAIAKNNRKEEQI